MRKSIRSSLSKAEGKGNINMKLKIKTHSGSEYEVELADYNAAETNEKLNRNDVNTVAFGDVIISRIDVKSVVPVEEPIVEEPPVEQTPIEETTSNDEEVLEEQAV